MAELEVFMTVRPYLKAVAPHLSLNHTQKLEQKSQNAQKIRDDMSRLSEDVDSFKHIIDGALGQAAQRCNEDVERAQERLNVLKEQLAGVALEVSRLSGGALHGRDRTKL